MNLREIYTALDAYECVSVRAENFIYDALKLIDDAMYEESMHDPGETGRSYEAQHRQTMRDVI